MKKKAPPTPLGDVELTSRGFEIVKFPDLYNTPCSLQQSSLATLTKPGTSAIWLGTDDALPVVMAKHAAEVGVRTDKTEGWVPYPIPEQVSLSTRAHLSREQVAALVVHLQRWLKSGSFTI